jgi:NAD(P)-dependent dehydrogenase (short-subunit alcohol dehydrogenase family)
MSDSPFNLTGKVALVTGGNSGIGLGMAEGLLRAGAHVCIWGTNESKNAAAAERLRAIAGSAERAGGAPAAPRVLARRCDVSDEAAVERGFAELLGELGRIDACFANAGVTSARTRSFVEMTAAEWRRVLGVNLDGTFFTLRAAARHMQQRGGGGSLAATASLSALLGMPRAHNYAASKGGIVSMMRGLAVELGRHGIRANAIVPGWIESEMTHDFLAGKPAQERVLPRVPLRRWGEGSDFAGLAVYLASDASAYHTGDVFVIDGAYSLF